ncbi:hypothetical protein B0G57_12521 [Trinickia symbiotica]|nr:hypothetical protein B0G57_12521 [Trinickia symbiotica]
MFVKAACQGGLPWRRLGTTELGSSITWVVRTAADMGTQVTATNPPFLPRNLVRHGRIEFACDRYLVFCSLIDVHRAWVMPLAGKMQLPVVGPRSLGSTVSTVLEDLCPSAVLRRFCVPLDRSFPFSRFVFGSDGRPSWTKTGTARKDTIRGVLFAIRLSRRQWGAVPMCKRLGLAKLTTVSFGMACLMNC